MWCCGNFCVMSSILIVFLIITVPLANTKNCQDGDYLDNGVGVSYEPNNGLLRGCISDIKPCIRKCCPRGQAMVDNNCTTYDNNFRLEVYNDTNPISVEDDYFYYIYNRYCAEGSYRLSPLKYPADYFYVQYNGSLYRPNATHKEKMSDPEDYCMDLFIDGEIQVISGLFCFSEEQMEVKNTLFSYGLFILMPCLLVTFIVYAFIPERNIHAKSLMHYLITLFGSLLILTFTQLYPEHTDDCICKALGLSFLFLNLVAFFWMNVMCIDIWRTFRDLRGVSRIRKKSEQRRFKLYCGYAWGTPLLYIFILTSLILNDSSLPEKYSPGMAAGECWFRGVPSLLYYHVPLTLLIISNFTLFCLTARNIKQVQQDTAMLRQGQCRKHTYDNEKQRFNLDLKLMVVMGVNRIINWLVAIIAWAVEWRTGCVPNFVWYLDDVFDALYGVFVIIIYVLNRDIWKQLKQRFYQIMGIAQLERGQTCTRTATTNL